MDPFQPTDAPPGSEEKIQVLCRRVATGREVPLHQIGDRHDFEGIDPSRLIYLLGEYVP